MTRVSLSYLFLTVSVACGDGAGASETKSEDVSEVEPVADRAGRVADSTSQAGQAGAMTASMAANTTTQTQTQTQAGGDAGTAGMMVASAIGGAGSGGGAGVGGMPMAGAGGMAAGTAAPKGAPTFTAIFKEILTVGSAGNCMFAGCHGAPPDPMLNGNLTITFDDQMGAYKNLVGVTSTSTACSGKPLVVPGDAAGSLLMQKFTDSPPCGVKMPIGRPLTDAQIKQIETWITEGAENN